MDSFVAAWALILRVHSAPDGLHYFFLAGLRGRPTPRARRCPFGAPDGLLSEGPGFGKFQEFDFTASELEGLKIFKKKTPARLISARNFTNTSLQKILPNLKFMEVLPLFIGTGIQSGKNN